MSNIPRDITEVKDLAGKRVLVRASLNVPFNKEGILLDDFRLQKALGTIRNLKKHGAKTIIIGHLGRDAHISLAPVFRYFKKHIDLEFSNEVIGPSSKNSILNMEDGDVLLLENLRRESAEVENDLSLAKELASYADIYVNDCFSTSHRNHASIVGIPRFLPSYIGLLFKSELEELEYARNPEHPALFILGGAKFATKQPLVEKFLGIYDHVFITGALANDFFKAKGLQVGKSLVSDPPVNVNHLLDHPKILLPIDVVVLTKDGEKITKKTEEVNPEDTISDAGQETIGMLKPIVKNAKFILWNGPLGEYKFGFIEGTKGLVRLIAESEADSIVGGGDTMSLITKFGFDSTFSFCSTAGGSMLEFLLRGTIPGIEAIIQSEGVENA